MSVDKSKVVHTCSSAYAISRDGESFLQLCRVHVHHVEIWEQHGCQKDFFGGDYIAESV